MIIYIILFSSIYANFEVAPQIQELSLDRQSTQKIHIKNGTSKLKKIKIYSERPKNQNNQDLYMGDWIIVYPKIVYLKPNSKKIIRMSARPPKDLVDGEYRSHLVFEELPVNKYDAGEKDENKVGVNLDVIHILVSTVYGYKGELKRDGIFEDFRVVTDEDNTYFLSKITNTGTAALDIVYKTTYYNGVKKLKTEDIIVGKVMRNNYTNSVAEVKNLPKDANKMSIEIYYRIKNKVREGKGGEKEYHEFKIGEKNVPIERMTKEEYFKKYGEES